LSDGDVSGSSELRGFDRSLPMRLLRAHEAVLRTFTPHLKAHDLSTQQWRVMRVLVEFGEFDVTELAEACSLLRPSVSRIVQNLEQREIVGRRACPADNRRSLVSITEKGRSLIAELAPESEARYRYIENQFGAANLDELYALLEHLVNALAADPPAFGSLEGEAGSEASQD